MASVTLKKISKCYPGEVHAVRDLDLEIRDGEFLVLVGPSGCGKSTTLRMVAGLETISAGTLKIGDRVVNGVHPRDRDIAMVFQNYALYPHMTVEQNLSFALKMRKTPKAQIVSSVAWAAELLGLEGLLKRKPKELSGGQRQRVALGRAIVRKPAVFLFDEPLSNLDAKLRVETRAEIKRLHRQLKTTTIYVTHDQEEAMTLGDRVVVMCDGFLRQSDSPLEVYQRPADQFVASFLGMPPMNFFKGEIEQIAETVWFIGADARLRLDEASPEWLAGEKRRPVVAGIRPEHFELIRSAPNGDSPGADSPVAVSHSADPYSADPHSIVATVQVVELLGSTMDVYLETTAGSRLVCRVPVSTLREGESVAARVAPKEIHLFDPNQAGEPGSSTHYGRSLKAPRTEAVTAQGQSDQIEV